MFCQSLFQKTNFRDNFLKTCTVEAPAIVSLRSGFIERVVKRSTRCMYMLHTWSTSLQNLRIQNLQLFIQFFVLGYAT